MNAPHSLHINLKSHIANAPSSNDPVSQTTADATPNVNDPATGGADVATTHNLRMDCQSYIQQQHQLLLQNSDCPAMQNANAPAAAVIVSITSAVIQASTKEKKKEDEVRCVELGGDKAWTSQ